MSQPAVSAEGLGKSYRVFDSPRDRFLEVVTRRQRHRRFQALSDVSFELPRGEGLGVIGENGAGKSTLLKMIAGIVAPSEGRLRVEGRVASILELGSSFHPELTGRQNIVLNAAMLGLTEAQVRQKTPEIVEFSELGDFIEQPVKVYSTGMGMRLGFAIATQVEPDVLIIDEALSVGDGYFQKKCMDRLRHFLAEGGTLLFCSHAMYYVSAFCKRVLWLRAGREAAQGPTDEVVRDYEAYLLRKSIRREDADNAALTISASALQEETGRRPARILEARLVTPLERAKESPATIGSGGPLALEIAWETSSPELQFHLGVGLNRADEVEVASFSSRHDGLRPWAGRSDYRTRLVIPELPLVKGDFSIYVFLLDEAGLHIHDQKILRQAFRVEASGYHFGVVRIPHDWNREDVPEVQPLSMAKTTVS